MEDEAPQTPEEWKRQFLEEQRRLGVPAPADPMNAPGLGLPTPVGLPGAENDAGKVVTDPSTGQPMVAPGDGRSQDPQRAPGAPSQSPMLLRNPYGQHGAPDHVATVDRLDEMARREFPNARIEHGISIRGVTGVNKRPDVTAFDPATGTVLKVYEAARTQADGSFVKREREKKTQYDKAGIPSHFEPVKP